MNKQALYDFDGTITSKDTTILLLVELLKLRPWRLPRLTWFLLRMILANSSEVNQRYKNKAIGYLIKDLSDSNLRGALQNFVNKVKPLYRQSVMLSTRQAIRDGCKVIIVTASPSFAISECVSDLPVLVLGTEFEKEENIYTGQLKSKNCYGQEKVKRINEWAKSNNVTLNIQSAWSDHVSDFDMLNLSENRYWIGGEELRKLIICKDPEANFLDTEY